MRSETLDWLDITNFLGVDSPNALPQNPALSRDMVNVFVEEGSLIPRPGAATFQTSAHDEIVTGFVDYNYLGTIHTLRFSATGIQEWNGSAWADLTVGTGFTATAGNFIDATMFKDDLYLIPKPDVKPYKWTAAAGTVTQDSGARTGRTLMNYYGYLLNGYANGGPRDIDYTADGSTWNAADRMTMNDTPGYIVRMLPYGGKGYIYKNLSIDSIVGVFSNTTDFRQGVVTEDVGLGAFNTLVGVSNLGHLFLGSDARLYLNNGSLQPILKRLSDRIRAEINMAGFSQSFGSVDPTTNTYSIFYPVSSDTYSYRRMDINYLTGAATMHNFELLGQGLFVRGIYTRYGSGAPFFIMSDSTAAPVTYRLDTTTQITEAGTALPRYWTTDWLSVRGKEIGELQLTVKHRGRGIIKVMAADALGTVYDTLGTNTFKMDTKSINLNVDNLTDRIAGEDIISISPVNIRNADHVKFRVEFEPETNHDDVKLRQFSIGFRKTA